MQKPPYGTDPAASPWSIGPARLTAAQLSGPRLRLLLAVGAAAMLVSACDDGGRTARAAAQWRERQARIDPPQLWSVQAVHEAHGGKAVLICADSEVRSGFTSIIPASGAVHCAREVATTPTSSPSPNYRCMLSGVEYAVGTSVRGDRARDFEASSIVLRDGQTLYSRALRFRRLGSCPKGWNVGDTTNQKGQHLSGAVEQP